MPNKKLVSFVGIAAMLIVLAGCGSKTGVITEETPMGDGTIISDTNTTSVTKEQCIDVMAYALKVVELQTKGDTPSAMARAEKAAKLQEKYTLNDEQYEEKCGSYALSDPNIIQKAQERALGLK